MELWIILSFLSAIFYSLNTILSKKFLKKKNITPNQLTFEYGFILIFFSLIFFSPFIDFSSFFLYWHLFLLKSIFFILLTIFLLKLLEKYDISLVSPIQNLSPIILFILAFIFLGEILSKLQILGIFITIFSIIFLEITNDHHQKKNPPKHFFNFLKKKISGNFFFWSILVLISTSLCAIIDKIILQKVSVYTNLYFTGIFVFFGFLIFFLKKKSLKKNFFYLIREPQTTLIGITRFISDIFVLFAIALPNSLVSLVIVIKRCSTIINIFFGGLLFHEKHLLKKMICVLFSVVGIVLIVV